MSPRKILLYWRFTLLYFYPDMPSLHYLPRFVQGAYEKKVKGVWVNMGAQPPYPHEKAKWESMRPLANWRAASRAELEDSSVLPFGCGDAPIPPHYIRIRG